MALEPRLTKLDERVLAMLPSQPPGVRASRIAKRLREPASEVRLILRGFEHLGKVQQRGGWWRSRPQKGGQE